MTAEVAGIRAGLWRVRRWRKENRKQIAAVLNIVQFAMLAAILIWLPVRGASQMGYNWQWYRVPRYLYRVIDGEVIWGPIVRGLIVTIEIGIWSLILTLVFGLTAALLRLSSSWAGRIVARTYLDVIRNTPVLVQLFLVFYVLAPIFGIDRFWSGVLTLALFEGAHAMEIFRAGIQSVGRGQWEAAESLGLSRFDTYRDVVLPQALRLILPPLTGLIVNLIKHSAIVSAIAIADLTTAGRNVVADTYMSYEIWFTVAGIYLVLTVTLSIFVSWLEHRLRVRN